jgi:hypothetical protein
MFRTIIQESIEVNKETTSLLASSGFQVSNTSKAFILFEPES